MTTVADHQALLDELRPPLALEEAMIEADRCRECGGPYPRRRAPSRARRTSTCPVQIERQVIEGWESLLRRCDQDAAE